MVFLAQRRSMVKVIFFLIMCLVLNLTVTVASAVVWSGCNSSLPSERNPCILCPHPFITTFSVKPAGMVLGKDVNNSASSPSGQVKSIEIIEQSFVPGLLTNSSKRISSLLTMGKMRQFWTSNIWGSAGFVKRSFTFAVPSISANITSIAVAIPAKKPFQYFQLAIQIPLEYRFYQWAFFIMAGLRIIMWLIDSFK